MIPRVRDMFGGYHQGGVDFESVVVRFFVIQDGVQDGRRHIIILKQLCKLGNFS